MSSPLSSALLAARGSAWSGFCPLISSISTPSQQTNKQDNVIGSERDYVQSYVRVNKVSLESVAVTDL